MTIRIKTDCDFVVTVEEDSEGVLLGISHGIGSTECVLRPIQAERLAAELLAYASGGHDGGYVCDECGEPGDGHRPGCAWGPTS